MLHKKASMFPAAMVLFSFLGVPLASAQAPVCPFTNASLQGNFAIVGTYGANVALALATRHYDGLGNLPGAYIVNGPTAGSTTGARTISTGTQAGTYTVNCDGTGKINRVLTQSNGSTTNQVDDFIITAAVPTFNGLMIATAIVDATEVPSTIVPGGVFVFRTQTRLPD